MRSVHNSIAVISRAIHRQRHIIKQESHAVVAYRKLNIVEACRRRIVDYLLNAVYAEILSAAVKVDNVVVVSVNLACGVRLVSRLVLFRQYGQLFPVFVDIVVGAVVDLYLDTAVFFNGNAIVFFDAYLARYGSRRRHHTENHTEHESQRQYMPELFHCLSSVLIPSILYISRGFLRCVCSFRGEISPYYYG